MTFLTIIFPAYNEEQRLPRALDKTLDFARRYPKMKFEVIIVENGSTDKTYSIAIEKALEIARRPDSSNLAIRIEQSSPGKGSAIRYGLSLAKGKVALLTDVDLSTPLRYIPNFLAERLRTGSDIVIASRNLTTSVVVGRNGDRRLAGRLFHLLTSTVVPGIHDTQCGFKLLSRKAIDEITSRLTIDGFAIDVEILKVARIRGLSINECPVYWKHDPASTVNIVRDSTQMTLDLFKIQWNHATGRYN